MLAILLIANLAREPGGTDNEWDTSAFGLC
jgi:hypothetical protein